ncbi:K+/H+ antiporter YhaU regulatory subunit KhtT [Rhodoglobus vestalii]|uniref:K+/H+ antiporter YhaU regulatory subunit KhtT n=1 Tax=Rhodoglobus vestalii TaxID=193384 RepID=A0A8H2K858_9MICO|nr:TrkA C-terminal domain-containing protein [Rhodoglobus vestalii]TQO20652.1 K+/H+ antiporter YhaU regulatory subunit KhtT [Rhodoglobus vestalii]
MTALDPDLEEVHVREHPLPGVARLFELALSGGTVLQIFTESDSSDSHLAVLPPDADTPVVNLRLSNAEAVTLSSLISGVKFVIRAADEAGAADAASPSTVKLRPASPAVGKRLHEIEVPEPDQAQVLAVIRDDTEELLDGDVERRCQVGDRLVVVGRPDALARLVRYLHG